MQLHSNDHAFQTFPPSERNDQTDPQTALDRMDVKRGGCKSPSTARCRWQRGRGSRTD